MNKLNRAIIHGVVALLAGIGFLSCDEVISEQTAPVLLTATVTDILTQVDLTDPECPSPTVTIELRATPKRTTLPGGGSVDTRFLDVILLTRRTTYVRTDGGTVVPRTFIENINVRIPATGTATSLPPSLILAPGALSEAPFVALRPEAGGRDPETGLSFIRIEVIAEYFGETLAGEPVVATVRYPLTICINCGGCQPSEGAG